MKKHLVKSLGCALVIVGLVGCSKLSLENYDRLKMGMERSEVEAIIGGATECSETLGATNCFWGDKEGKHINVKFAAGKAVMFSHDGLN